MAIIQTINEYQFVEAFRQCGRGEQFSREALFALHEYLEGLSEDLGEPIELDVIALCCDFCESDAQEIVSEYSIKVENGEEPHEAALEYLSSETMAIDLGETILYQQF